MRRDSASSLLTPVLPMCGAVWTTSYGATGTALGEAVFATGMTGYQETITDPSYARQLVVPTAPHIGNTGVNSEDAEARRIWVAGYIVRDAARRPSNWRSERSLDEELVLVAEDECMRLDLEALRLLAALAGDRVGAE